MIRLNVLLFVVLWVGGQAVSDVCRLRCIAKCLQSDQTHNTLHCQTNCKTFTQQDCDDLPSGSVPATPVSIRKGPEGVEWERVKEAAFYRVQYRDKNQNDWKGEQLSTKPSASNISSPGDFCSPTVVRVSAVNEAGDSPFSSEVTLEPPRPLIDPKLTLVSMKYSPQAYITDFYQSNGTVAVTFKYNPMDWPLGSSDLEVTPMFHMINCEQPDLSQGVPLPDFAPGTQPNTLVGLVGGDMMERHCRFVYYVQSVESRQCKTETEMHTPPADALQTLDISCETVENNPCQKVDYYDAPVCGQINNISFEIVNLSAVNVGDPNANLTLNVSFESIVRVNEKPTLYYIVLLGVAEPYKNKEEEQFLGVNMTDILTEFTDCLQMNKDGTCARRSNNTVMVDGVHFDKLYGLMFCAVKDPRNLTLPRIDETNKAFKPRSSKILIESRLYKKSKTGLIVGLVVGITSAVLIALFALCFWNNRKQKEKNKIYQIKLAQMEREKENRYTEFPKKNDIWEIERRNLIIHNDRKLGSGAFGAVYLGKLLGKSLGHKDSTSPLGVNLMRMENCEVAVKMLPELADEMSKEDFLREIALMKTLGYHERLVNMMACVTGSEPLCLVVEYCSNGDLLNFLKERCTYMMKLDDMGVNYNDPSADDDFDVTMIITLKQLLMFAVQISYGLEYLSQKGFVHRDVAARNVLVHEGSACKIGDFGLCRYIYGDESAYKSKGGRLPLKWMSPEAIRHYEFSTKSDVWSFGILLFEIITLGGSPYPQVPADEMLSHLENGGRMERPDNCPDEFYSVMESCWAGAPSDRPAFSAIRQMLATQLEDVTEEYSYLKLDSGRDYYNVSYSNEKPATIFIPPSETDTRESDVSLSSFDVGLDKGMEGKENPAFEKEVV